MLWCTSVADRNSGAIFKIVKLGLQLDIQCFSIGYQDTRKSSYYEVVVVVVVVAMVVVVEAAIVAVVLVVVVVVVVVAVVCRN